MVNPFGGIPLVLINCCTINLGLCPIDGNLKALVDQYRKRLRRMLNMLSDGAFARGKFDMVLKLANGLEFEIPDGELPPELQDIDLPELRYGMIHIHFPLFEPTLSRKEIREVMVSEFPGKKRVCVEKAKEDVKRPNGNVTSGPQGFLEYLSMEKTEFEFGEGAKDAVLEYAELDETWSRANRNFSFGEPPSDSTSIYDPERVIELEAADRRIKVKKDWNKLGYAEQFLHLWMTDASACFNIVRDRILVKSLRGYTHDVLNMVLMYHLLISNWSRYPHWFGRYFIDFGMRRASGVSGGAAKLVPP